MYIAKQFTFDAAHVLPDHPGKCSRLHGHTYKLEVMLEGEMQANGMVYDFYDLKQIINEKVLLRLDHTFLNDLISPSTVENITLWIWNELASHLPLYQVTVWETPTSFAQYRGAARV